MKVHLKSSWKYVKSKDVHTIMFDTQIPTIPVLALSCQPNWMSYLKLLSFEEKSNE